MQLDKTKAQLIIRAATSLSREEQWKFIYFTQFTQAKLSIQTAARYLVPVVDTSDRVLKFQDGLGQMLQTIDILISRLLVGPACLPACLYSQFTSPTVHTKNGATDPPINTRGTGQKKLEQPGQLLPPPSCFFVVSGSLAPFFAICGETVKLTSISCLLI